MGDSIETSKQLTRERHERRHRAARKTLYCATPEGVAITADVLLQPLIDYLASGDPDARPPSEGLNDRLGRIPDPNPHVALAILSPVLDAIARGWASRAGKSCASS